jgi:hypothetical protein
LLRSFSRLGGKTPRLISPSEIGGYYKIKRCFGILQIFFKEKHDFFKKNLFFKKLGFSEMQIFPVLDLQSGSAGLHGGVTGALRGRYGGGSPVEGVGWDRRLAGRKPEAILRAQP